MSDKTLGHCNRCGPKTNHIVLFEERTSWSHEEYPIWGSDRYELLKCAGCDSIKLRHTTIFSEDDPEHPEVKYFPPASFRAEPDWLSELAHAKDKEGRAIQQLLKEVYSAVHNDLRGLAAMGVRALLEHVMVSAGGDQGTFVKNLQAFEVNGHVSKTQRNRLETILEAGHASIHRGFTPSTADVKTLVDIAESIVVSVFIHGEKVDSLKKRIPKRPAKKKVN